MIFKKHLTQAIVDPPVSSQRKSTSLYASESSIAYTDENTGLREVAGGCLRKQYYRLTGAVPTNTERDGPGMLKMEAGNYLQDMIEEKFKLTGLWRGSETSFKNPRFNISGRIDFWLADPTVNTENGEVLVPTEMKTTGLWGTRGCMQPVDNKMTPKEDHLLQMIPYLDYYSQFIPNIKGTLLYLCRDSMDYVEHTVYFGGQGAYGIKVEDDQRFIRVENETGLWNLKHLTVRGVYKRVQQLVKHIRAKEVPEGDYVDQWSNARIHTYAKHGRWDKLNKTQTKAVLNAVKKDPERLKDDSNPLVQKGDWQCRYCEFYTLCKHGIKHMAGGPIRQENPTSLAPAEPKPVEDTEGSPI